MTYTRTRVLLLAGMVLMPTMIAAQPAAASTVIDCSTTDLQPVLTAAPSGATIRIKGTCVGNFSTEQDVVTLEGDPSATLDGASAGRTLAGQSLTLKNLTVTDGVAPYGAGIFSDGALTLDHVTVDNNLATSTDGRAEGGGIQAEGSASLTDSSVKDNRIYASLDSSDTSSASDYGAGIECFGALTLANTDVTGNVAVVKSASTSAKQPSAYGGGIAGGEGTLTIENSKVDSNRVSVNAQDGSVADGAGVDWFQAGSVIITDSHVDDNVSDASGSGGSGVEADASAADLSVNDLQISGSTFDGNHSIASSTGAASSKVDGALNLAVMSGAMTSSEIVGSSDAGTSSVDADGQGGAIDIAGSMVISRTVIRGTSVTLNSPPDEGYTGGAIDDTATDASQRLNLSRDTISGTTIVPENVANGNIQAYGVGLWSSASTLISDTTIDHNVLKNATSKVVVSRGGGLDLADPIGATPTDETSDKIVDSTIADNSLAVQSSASSSAQALGGGLYIETQSVVALVSDTIAGNAVSGQSDALLLGGGLYVDDNVTTQDTLIATNRISVAADGPDCSEAPISKGYNLIGNSTGCDFTSAAGDKVGVASPKLGVLKSNGGPTQTIALAKTSPAVNVIPKSKCATISDERGVKRPQGSKCDIGAYEYR